MKTCGPGPRREGGLHLALVQSVDFGPTRGSKTVPRAETPEVCLSLPQLMATAIKKITAVVKEGMRQRVAARWG